MLTEDGHVLNRRNEGLMTPAVFVIDVLADDLPGGDVEEALTKDFVGVGKAVENKPNESVSINFFHKRGKYKLMCDALAVCEKNLDISFHLNG